MKKSVIAACAVIFIISLGGCGKEDSKSNDTEANKNKVSGEAKNKKQGTSIYLVAMDRATESTTPEGIANCSGDVVEIESTEELSPEKALEKLFAYKEYDEEKGAFNAFAASKGLQIENMILQNDFAIVKLSKNLVAKDITCDDLRMHDQIRKTLLQFPNIKGVDIFVGDKELGEYLRTAGRADTK